MKNTKQVPFQDAYSFSAYGSKNWLACIEMLAARGYDIRQVEAILRSKWSRWAADAHQGRGNATASDLERFIDNPRNEVTPAEVEEMAAQIVGPFELHEHHAPKGDGRIVHSHDGGNFPQGHSHPGYGPAKYTIDKQDWARATGGLAGGSKKVFTATPEGPQLESLDRRENDKSFDVHGMGSRLFIDPREAAAGIVQLSGAVGFTACRMMLTFGLYCNIVD